MFVFIEVIQKLKTSDGQTHKQITPPPYTGVGEIFYTRFSTFSITMFTRFVSFKIIL